MAIDRESSKLTCDFWIGVFPDEDSFADYVGERPDYYSFLESNPATVRLKPKGASIEPDEMPLSRFIGDQGLSWYDHDLLEAGFNNTAKSVSELVQGYSWSDQYADELSKLAAQYGVSNANGFLFVDAEVIANPRSVINEEFIFHHVGKITFNV